MYVCIFIICLQNELFIVLHWVAKVKREEMRLSLEPGRHLALFPWKTKTIPRINGTERIKSVACRCRRRNSSTEPFRNRLINIATMDTVLLQHHCFHLVQQEIGANHSLIMQKAQYSVRHLHKNVPCICWVYSAFFLCFVSLNNFDCSNIWKFQLYVCYKLK